MPQNTKKSPAKLRFNPFDWAILATAVITAIYAIFNFHAPSPLYLAADLVTLLAGAFYMVLSAKGRRSNFIFSLFSVLACVYIAWANQFYGNAALNAFYYLPCALIGFYLWGRHSRKTHEVIARKLSPRQLTLIIAGVAAATISLSGQSVSSLPSKYTLISYASGLLFTFCAIADPFLSWELPLLADKIPRHTPLISRRFTVITPL